MSRNRTSQWLTVVAAIVLSVPAFAQDTNAPSEQGAKPAAQASVAPASTSVMSGAKQKAAGIITQSEADGFVMRQAGGGEVAVKITGATQVVEKKANPFRGAKRYAPTQLVRGLQVEVEGRGDSAGTLVADKIRFTGDALKTAEVVETRVTPVENRMGSAETRLKAGEENAQRLSGQIEELGMVAAAAKGDARAAQQTADSAIAGVGAANERIGATNERIGAIDDYQPVQSTSVLFKAGSAVLSDEAKAALDQLASQAKGAKGFVIEVAGFASKDGTAALNQSLSDRRAQAVVRYLAQTQDVPLRRIVTPFGYGTSHPVADNSTRAGRRENRRVEVKLLVSKGLTMSASMNAPANTAQTPSAPAPAAQPESAPDAPAQTPTTPDQDR